MTDGEKCQVISFINMKGGVGKTTLTIGIADYLANYKNKKVLVIDADPQFNATQGLLEEYKKLQELEKELKATNEEERLKELEEKLKEHDSEKDITYYTEHILKNKKTIYQLFQPQRDMTESFKTPDSSELIVELLENNRLDILCGDLNLVLANKNSDYSLIKRIKNFIADNNLKSVYDYIFIDCPPTLTIYTDSALMASDYYIIPNRIDRYSIIGIDSLQKAVGNLIHEERIDLKCLGIIYTMVYSNINKKQAKIKTDFESKSVVNNLEIFDAKSHVVNHIQFGSSGTLPTKYKASREDIEAISLELERKIKDIKEG